MADQEKKAPDGAAAATEAAVAAAQDAATSAASVAAEAVAEKAVAPAAPEAAPTEEVVTTVPDAIGEAGSKTAEAATVTSPEAPEEAIEAKAAEPAAPAAAPIVVPVVAPAAAPADPIPAASANANDEAKAPASGESAPARSVSSHVKDLWAVAKSHGHPEIWGVTLADPETHVPSSIIFQKYLNANDGDLAKAKDQLTKTLDWRAKMRPLELIRGHYNKTKFGGLGYITTYTADGAAEVKGPEAKEVFTWNIYGGVKSIEETFGKLEEFIEWRVALMELAVHELSIPTATEPITAEKDPYKIYQVHDYKSISFLLQPPAARVASKETIAVLATNYPELLKEKFFVNVPAVMGFMYGVMKLFVAPKTLRRFHPMSNSTAMAREFGSSKVPGLGEKLPKEYGGKGEDLIVTGKETLLEE